MNLTLVTRLLRKNQTDVEKTLWNKIRNRQLENKKFKRQKQIGKYIVDFVCLEKKVVIELDGSHHSETKEYDEVRTEWLEIKGFKVIRFWNNEVIKNIEGVLEIIRKAVT